MQPDDRTETYILGEQAFLDSRTKPLPMINKSCLDEGGVGAEIR